MKKYLYYTIAGLAATMNLIAAFAAYKQGSFTLILFITLLVNLGVGLLMAYVRETPPPTPPT